MKHWALMSIVFNENVITNCSDSGRSFGTIFFFPPQRRTAENTESILLG